MKPENDLQTWNYDTEIYSEKNIAARNHFQDLMKKLFRGRKYKSMLVFGAGSGCDFEFLKKYSRKITAIDSSSKMVDIANKFIKQKKLKGIIVEKGNANNLKHKDNSFDCIYCFNVVHHIKGTRFIRQAHRVLKKNGEFIAFEPNILFPLSAPFHLILEKEWGTVEHNRFSVKKQFKRYFRKVSVRSENHTIFFGLSKHALRFLTFMNRITRIKPFNIFSISYVLRATK